MNKEDMIRMARQAGFPEAILELSPIALERFAALVASAEREACAKIADIAEPYKCADLIRTRG